MKVYALNLFNIADRDEYLAYSKRSAREVQAHGGRVVALGRFRETAAGDIEPRVRGTSDYIWHLFERLEDLRPLLK